MADEKTRQGEPPVESVSQKKRKIPWGMLYILTTIAAILIFGICNQEFGNVFRVITSLTPGFLVLSILIMAVYFVFEGGIIRLLMRSQSVFLGLPEAVKIGIIGVYYSNITPSATGGQPMQSAYLLRDNKVSVGTSTAVLIMKFFCFQCAIVACSAISFAALYGRIAAENSAIIPFIWLGLLINGGSLIFFPCLFIRPVLHTICRFAKWLTGKWKVLQRRFHFSESIDRFEQDFSSYRDDFKKKKKSLLYGILLSVPEVVLQMSMLYCVYRSFGYGAGGYWEVSAMQCLLQTSVSFVPMPGASGAQEIGFSSFFRNYFVNDDLYTGMMVWRFFTYYLVVIAGALLVVADQFFYGRKKKRDAGDAMGN